MSDAEDKTSEQLAAEINGSQNEQVVTAPEVTEPSASAPATNGEEEWGKFKSKEELLKGYNELEHKLRTTRPVETSTPSPAPTAPAQFDPETEAGVQAVVERKLAEKDAALEAARVKKFTEDHAEELKDPLLRGVVQLEIQEANRRGEYMDQETALTNAKKTLDERLATKVEDAKKEGFDDGKALQRRKEQAGAVGVTTAAVPDVDESTLTADEYAALHNLERSY